MKFVVYKVSMQKLQKINRELNNVILTIKDDSRLAVQQLQKEGMISEESAAKLSQLLTASIDASFMKSHPFFEKSVNNILKDK